MFIFPVFKFKLLILNLNIFSLWFVQLDDPKKTVLVKNLLNL
jgi:hypothetical protein